MVTQKTRLFQKSRVLWRVPRPLRKDQGPGSLVTCNHDTIRARYNLDPGELALAYAFIFTMPGVPFLYYGDEIGMRCLNLPAKEGGYFRTGSRMPMQWNKGANLGFSDAPADALYLPVDPSPDAPTVEEAEKDPASILHTVRSLLKLRGENPDLQAAANLEIIHGETGELPLVYTRGAFVLAVNPGVKEAAAPVPFAGLKPAGCIGLPPGACALKDGVCRMGPQRFGIWRAP